MQGLFDYILKINLNGLQEIEQIIERDFFRIKFFNKKNKDDN